MGLLSFFLFSPLYQSGKNLGSFLTNSAIFFMMKSIKFIQLVWESL